MKSSFARRTAIAAAFAAPVAVQAASFNEPSGGYGTVPYGDITLSWSGDEGSPVYLGLANGPEADLHEVTSLNGGYVTYPSNSAKVAIPSSLPAGAYVFTITTEKSSEAFSSGFCISTCYPASGTSGAATTLKSIMPTSTGSTTYLLGDPLMFSSSSSATDAASTTYLLGDPLIFTSSSSAAGATPSSGMPYGVSNTTGYASSSSGVGSPTMPFTGGAMGGRTALGLAAGLATVLGGGLAALMML